MLLEDLIQLIPSWNATRPNFVATVSATLQPLVAASATAATVPSTFDLDAAIGVQLDVVGVWVGRSRNVSLPIPQPYFAFNNAMYGFGSGVWKGPYSGTFGVSSLDDETYRRLLRANILANHWDGTIPAAQTVFDTFFIDPETFVFVQDNAQVPYPVAFFSFGVAGKGFNQGNWHHQLDSTANTGVVDVSMTIGIAGKIPPPIYLGLLSQNAIPIKPGGVTTNYAVTTVNKAPLFGFGVQNKYVSGFGAGAWGATPERLLTT